MEETLAREIRRAERNQRPLNVIMLDIDHFKQFNDTFGHEAGDAVLRELGQMLKVNTRGGDVACRFGGEEFVLILPETTLGNAKQRAEDLREKSRQLTVLYHSQALGIVTISLGLATFPECATTAEALLRSADTALYRAKAEGRDRVVTAEGS
jgi:diguanylate cyclase (GGDEF)-like protein